MKYFFPYLIIIILFSCKNNKYNEFCNYSRGKDFFSERKMTDYRFFFNLQDAIKCASHSNKKLLLIFRSITCNSCPGIDVEVLKDKKVGELINDNLIPVILYIDDKENSLDTSYCNFLRKNIQTVGDANTCLLAEKYNCNTAPFYALMDGNFQQIGEGIGLTRLKNKEKFIEFLNQINKK